MMKSLSRALCRETGQTVVVGAFALLAVMGVLAVSFDIGAAWLQRRNLQNVADAAALAGAQSLNGQVSGRALAEADARNYVSLHSGLAASDAVATATDTDITVVVNKSMPRIIAGTFGLGNNTIRARARARIAAPLLPGPGATPLAIELSTYNNCVQNGVCTGITLKETSGNNGSPPSAYGWMNYSNDGTGNGGGADELCDGFVGGSAFPVHDPDTYKPGGNNKAHNCVPDRMAAAAHNNCLTLADVLDSNGALKDRCNPLSGAGKGADPSYPSAQPTAVIVIPVIAGFDGTGCSTGPKCVDVIGTGQQLRTFAIFLVDLTTVQRVGNVGPTCNKNGQCWITGQFLLTHFAPVSTQFNLPTGTYNPNALLKIIQLVD